MCPHPLSHADLFSSPGLQHPTEDLCSPGGAPSTLLCPDTPHRLPFLGTFFPPCSISDITLGHQAAPFPPWSPRLQERMIEKQRVSQERKGLLCIFKHASGTQMQNYKRTAANTAGHLAVSPSSLPKETQFHDCSVPRLGSDTGAASNRSGSLGSLNLTEPQFPQV